MTSPEPWTPVGIDTTERFRAYVDRLRATASAAPAHSKHGPSTETRRHSYETMPTTTTATATDTDSDRQTTTPAPNYGLALARLDGAAFYWLDAAPLASPEATTGALGRRAFMLATAAAAASTVGVGTAAANDAHGLNYDSELIPNPTIPATATIAESRPEMGALEYIGDGGDDEIISLADQGATVAPGPEDDPHNPVSFRADYIAASVYERFPNDVTYEDTDGNEQALSALEAQHWSTDSAVTVSDTETEAGGPVLKISSSGVSTEATANFTDYTLDSGVDRTQLQVGFTVDNIAAGGTVEIRLKADTGNSRAVVIDPNGTEDDTNVIGTGDETAAIRQVELGELSATLDAIDEVEIAIVGADATIELFALAVERADRWSFGTRQIVDPDDSEELTTETIYEPTGRFSLTDYGSLPATFREEPIADHQIDVEFEARNLPSSAVDSGFEAAERYSQDQRFRYIANLELPAAYDLDLNVGNAFDTQRLGSSAYLAVELLVGDHDMVLLDDVGDYEDQLTDRTTAFDAGVDEEIDLSAMAAQGDRVTTHYELLVSDGQADEIQQASDGGIFGGGGREGSGGVMDMLLSLPGMIVTAVLGYGGFALARARGVIGGAR